MNRSVKISLGGLALATLVVILRQSQRVDRHASGELPAPLPLAQVPQGIAQPNSNQDFITKPEDVMHGFHGG